MRRTSYYMPFFFGPIADPSIRLRIYTPLHAVVPILPLFTSRLFLLDGADRANLSVSVRHRPPPIACFNAEPQQQAGDNGVYGFAESEFNCRVQSPPPYPQFLYHNA